LAKHFSKAIVQISVPLGCAKINLDLSALHGNLSSTIISTGKPESKNVAEITPFSVYYLLLKIYTILQGNSAKDAKID